MNHRKFSQSTSSISISIIVIGLILVINYFAGHNQIEIDFTQNKIHAFSDQTQKVMSHLEYDLKAEFYGDAPTKAKYAPLFENYQRLSQKFKIEYIDPFKEPTRVKASGIKKVNTLVLIYQGRSIKLDELNEEKITNGIIKIQKETKSSVCVVVGHGEASIEDATQNGMQSLKLSLEDQSYEVKEVSLSRVDLNSFCSSIVVLGPHGDLNSIEIKSISDYLIQGGRMVLALDAELTPKEKLSKDLRKLLSIWGIDVKDGIIVDPDSRKMGTDTSVVMINLYNPKQVITKNFQQPSYLPFARPVDFIAPAPSGLGITSIAKTNDQSWAETDVATFVKGTSQFNSGTETKGMLSVAVAAWGKLKNSNASRESRVVVFGSSQMVNNQYSRFGGNADLFMNAVSWVLQDENLISIRTKSDEQGKVEISEQNGIKLFWIIVVVIPFTFMLLGVLVWLQRKNR